MLYVCAVCSQSRTTTARETPWGKEPVPYLAVLPEDESIGAAKAYCCAQCVSDHDGPGKFEGNGDRHSVAVALILYAWSLDSGQDNEMSSEGWGWCGRFGRYLLFEDEQGFVTYQDHDTTEKADKRFYELYDMGAGATEWDAWISDDRGGYYVSFDGKHIGTYERFNRARAAVRLHAFKTGYYPDLWHSSERGNVARVDY